MSLSHEGSQPNTSSGCTLCVGALSEGEWCRACGYGKPESEPASERKAPLLEAIDKARHTDPIAFIEAYNGARRGGR